MSCQIVILSLTHVPKDVRVYHKIAAGLAEAYSVTIITLKPVREDPEKGVRFKQIPGGSRFAVLWQMLRVTRRLRPRLVICVEPVTMLVGLAMKKLFGCKVLFDCHEFFQDAAAEVGPRWLGGLRSALYGKLLGWLVERVDGALAVNEPMKRWLGKWNQNVTICANYPEKTELPEHKPPCEWDVIYTGGITPRKGMTKLLEAVNLLKDECPGLRVLFIGKFLEPRFKTEFFSTIRNHGLEKLVDWREPVELSELRDYLHRSAVGVCLLDTRVPRYNKALAIKLLEYMQNGLPVITNDIPFLDPLFQDEPPGVRIPFNSHALAKAIRKLLQPATATPMGRAGQRMIGEKYHWEREKPQLLQAVGELLPDREEQNERFLLISYFYPPLGGPGAQRPCKLTRYLEHAGIPVDVISVRDIVFHSLDPEMVKECGHASLNRTLSLDPMSILYRLTSGRTAKKVYFGTSEGWKRKIREAFPIDDKIGWAPFVLARGLQLLSQRRYRVVMTIMAPYSSAIAGWMISRLAGVPFVMDYRDHWTMNPYLTHATRWHRRLAEWTERKLLYASTLVTVIGETMRQDLIRRFGKELEDRIHVMHNGWDAADFHRFRQVTAKGVIRVRYVGNFYGHRSAAYFAGALEELQQEGRLPDNLKIEFTGNYYLETRQQLEPLVRAGILKIHSQVPHSQVIDLLADCDILLLFIASENGEGVLTGKIFEYLRSRCEILAMVPPEGEAASILREQDHTHICAMEDVPSIKQNFLALTELINRGDIPDRPVPLKYSRGNQTRSFLNALERRRHETT